MAEKVFRLPCGTDPIAEQCLDICIYLLRQWDAASRLVVAKTKSEGKFFVELRGDLRDAEAGQLMDLAQGKIPNGYTAGAGRATSDKDSKAAETLALSARRVTSDADKAKARRLFDHAKKIAETRNYDYAIEVFLNGLETWPDAVEDGHQPLRGCAVARRHSGGKKPGMTDSMKYSMNHKDPVRGMLNAEWLFSRDPGNANYMEGFLKSANRARCDDSILWMGAILKEINEAEKKASPKKFEFLGEVYEELGDRCQRRGEIKMAIESYDRAINAVDIQRRLSGDNNLQERIRNLSTKLTIVRGKYQTADSFRDSMQDGGAQRELHDKDRMVQGEDRLKELVDMARKEWEANPNIPGKLFTLVDLLCRQENEEREKEAIGILVNEFKKTSVFQYKTRAEDIRRSQLNRRVTAAIKAGDPEAVKAARIELLRFELPVFADRVKMYPSDQRLRFEYAVRLFDAGKSDDAIPLFQTARMDPKNRDRADLYMGRAFYSKGLYDQALQVLTQAITAKEVPDDDLGKQLTYWRARAEEAAGRVAEAKATYSQLLRQDYNYRDVRGRLEALSKSD